MTSSLPRVLFLSLAVALAVAGCGRKGSLEMPPGGNDEINRELAADQADGRAPPRLRPVIGSVPMGTAWGPTAPEPVITQPPPPGRPTDAQIAANPAILWTMPGSSTTTSTAGAGSAAAAGVAASGTPSGGGATPSPTATASTGAGGRVNSGYRPVIPPVERSPNRPFVLDGLVN